MSLIHITRRSLEHQHHIRNFLYQHHILQLRKLNSRFALEYRYILMLSWHMCFLVSSCVLVLFSQTELWRIRFRSVEFHLWVRIVMIVFRDTSSLIVYLSYVTSKKRTAVSFHVRGWCSSACVRDIPFFITLLKITPTRVRTYKLSHLKQLTITRTSLKKKNDSLSPNQLKH